MTRRVSKKVWNGKTSEVSNVVLPFQVIEQVDEPRAETPEEQPAAQFNFDDARPAALGLDQQADLGRQQADPLQPEERPAARGDRSARAASS